jgi:hypothetical protein
MAVTLASALVFALKAASSSSCTRGARKREISLLESMNNIYDPWYLATCNELSHKL